MIDQKQLENVECFSCLDGMINPGYPWQKQQDEGSFHHQIGRKLKKKLAKCCIWSIALFGDETWALRKDRWRVLKYDAGEGWRSVGPIMRAMKYYKEPRRINDNLETIERKKTKWNGYILRENWLLKFVIEGKI